jgi:excisionase family DNA binding protein
LAPVSRPKTARRLPLEGVPKVAAGQGLPDPGATGGEGAAHAVGGTQTGERYLTVREVAERLRLSTDTVYEAVKRGEIPHVRVSNAIRIPASAVP